MVASSGLTTPCAHENADSVEEVLPARPVRGRMRTAALCIAAPADRREPLMVRSRSGLRRAAAGLRRGPGGAPRRSQARVTFQSTLPTMWTSHAEHS